MLVSRYMLESDEAAESPLTSLSVKNFVRSVGSRTPAPGGGSVAALIGSLVSLISLYIYNVYIQYAVVQLKYNLTIKCL